MHHLNVALICSYLSTHCLLFNGSLHKNDVFFSSYRSNDDYTTNDNCINNSTDVKNNNISANMWVLFQVNRFATMQHVMRGTNTEPVIVTCALYICIACYINIICCASNRCCNCALKMNNYRYQELLYFCRFIKRPNLAKKRFQTRLTANQRETLLLLKRPTSLVELTC